ncbi:helix-hairpin-helix domain-containing protein [Streptomyces sp. NPDC057197]|uniref:helix-hairpin-helix domain-containing protein n=1 Tax=Streptomyces sp. NPDC057197 TaxID=3346045 RepID=UPI003629B542
MALRPHPRPATATSGPGRAPGSDSRTHGRRHRPVPTRSGPRRHQAPAEDLRRRAEALFAASPARAEQAGEAEESGSGPPGGDDPGAVRDSASRSTYWVPPGAPRARPVPPTAPSVPPPASPAQPTASVMSSAVPADTAPGTAGTAAATGAAEEAARTRRSPATLALALRERLPLWLQARCGVERRHAIALTVVLVAAAVLAAQHFWTGRTRSVAAPEVVRAAASRPGRAADDDRSAAPDFPVASDASAAAAPEAAAPAGARQIMVDVSGKVRHPGVHRLPAGSRVTDALRAAGGARPGTDLDGLNQARFLVDGEQLVVGGPPPATGPGTAAGAGAGTAPGAAGAPAGPVSLNTATADQLETLPGVGPVLAQHIVDYRSRHGGFRSVQELRQVTGIGDRRFADLRGLVTE